MSCIECDNAREIQSLPGNANRLKHAHGVFVTMSDEQIAEHGLIADCPCVCHEAWKLLQGGELARSVRERHLA